MEAYLDNAATTKVSESVKEIMVKCLVADYGNPSSMHQKGIDAEKYITEAKKIIADSMKVETKEIIFTSGGTESNNMALIGGVLANRRAGNHIITTQIEHPSVHNPIIYLEEMGFRVSYISVGSDGKVNMDALMKELCEETILVSVMYVNNEMGAIEDIAEIGAKIKIKNPNVLFHVDAIQAFGKYRIYPKRMNIDLLSVSGHKIHGPKGSGILFLRDKVKLKPIIWGGGQQKGMRSGTENVPAIAGLGQAIKEIYQNQEEKIKHLYELKESFIKGVEEIKDVVINGITEDTKLHDTAPHIVSVSIAGIKSEVLLHALEEKNIYISSGSACASNHPQLSGTLKAIGVKQNLLDSTLRFSFSVNTTMEEVEYSIKMLKEIVPMLRRFTRH